MKKTTSPSSAPKTAQEGKSPPEHGHKARFKIGGRKDKGAQSDDAAKEGESGNKKARGGGRGVAIEMPKGKHPVEKSSSLEINMPEASAYEFLSDFRKPQLRPGAIAPTPGVKEPESEVSTASEAYTIHVSGPKKSKG